MAKAVNAKVCLKCNRVLPLNDFYSNREWKEQNYHDAFCRTCYSRMCKDKDSVQDYFASNNRKWHDQIWDSSIKKAQYNLSNNASYLKATREDRIKMLDEAAARILPSVMNLSRYYDYQSNLITKDVFELQRQKNAQERSQARISYSPQWGGNFTQRQINLLQQKYAKYEKDVDLSFSSRQDYVRKVAKASMNADIAEDKYRRGQITVKEYSQVLKIFDDLSKSTALAQSSRKAGTSTALNSLGNIILGLEINHHLDINPFTFPEDDVDKVYNDYAHLAAAVGAQL